MLQEAALAHLARFATTEKGLIRILHRKIDRWARDARHQADTTASQEAGDAIIAVVDAARHHASAIVVQLAASGAVSDVAFAEGRSRSLSRAGRSRRAIGAHLAERGVGHDIAADALPGDPAIELAAALLHARKRRIGPFRKVEETPELRRRELASFARAGFDHQTASAALRMPAHDAETLIITFRMEL